MHQTGRRTRSRQPQPDLASAEASHASVSAWSDRDDSFQAQAGDLDEEGRTLANHVVAQANGAGERRWNTSEELSQQRLALAKAGTTQIDAMATKFPSILPRVARVPESLA